VHSLIRNKYHNVHMNAPYLALETKLAWSVFALSATPPRDGTAASLLVFGTLPRLPVSGLNQAAPLRNDCRLTVMLIARAKKRSARMFSGDSRKSSAVTLSATRTFRTEIFPMHIDTRATTKAQRLGTLDCTFLSARRDRRPTCWMDLQQRVFLS
jgi:hypothetical protein